MSSSSDRHKTGLDIWWLPDQVEVTEVKIEHEIVDEKDIAEENIRTPVFELQALALVNKPFEEVLCERCKIEAKTRQEAESLLYSIKFYGPYVMIGQFLVQATPNCARVIQCKDSRYSADLEVLQIREDMYGNCGICKIIGED